jgi:ElaB/YqjD/DUF883 family membrane-anchored ribosome-binding protein
MGEGEGQDRTQLTDDPEQRAAELRGEIEDVREDLGDTAAALAAKTDVKARARERVQEIKDTATGRKDELLSKVGNGGSGAGSASGSGSSDVAAKAGTALDRARVTARRNPVPTAAVGAIIGGFLLGRLSRRDP